MLPDLAQIARTIVWHAKDNDHSGTGIFAVLPKEIAKQFPIEGRENEDTSPSHVTILYLGEIPRITERKLLRIVNEVCENTKPFAVMLKKPRKFVNGKGQIILHSPVKSNKLMRFHDNLRTALLNGGIQVNNKFPDYKPHVTISFCNSKKELKQYKEIQPVGEWCINSIWLFGLKSGPRMVILGK